MDGSTSCALSDNESRSIRKYNLKTETDAVLLQSINDISTWERLKICFKPTYKLRRITNKGAILVLLFNFLITSVYYYTSTKSLTPEPYYCKMCFKLIEVPIGLALPFAGWLADIYFSRYRVILFGIVTMWISVLLLTVIFVVERFLPFTDYIQVFLLASLGFGYGCFQANVVQFGIDQLTDASTDEVISFINWYAWSYVSSGTFVNLISECAGAREKFIIPLLLCVSLSIVAGLIFWYNRTLIKEPVTRNPFKLIFQVLKYAMKHKYPERRSAFTYCEDELPSRIDFGKHKYGGPFTTEQVEDVKIFFGILGMSLSVSAVFGMTDEKDFQLYLLRITQTAPATFSKCMLRFLYTNTYYIAVTLLIPLNEVFIYPIFHRCTPSIKRHWKVYFGMTLLIVRYVVLVTLLTVFRKSFLDLNELFVNATPPCTTLFQENFHNNSYTYGVYSSVPELLSAISYVLIIIGITEFLCAQVPYSMKGLMVGIFYGSLVLFLVLNKGIFALNSPSWNFGTVFICGFWYLMIKLLFLLVTVTISPLVSLCYKKRKRDDILPNEQIFAERYYSKYSD